MQSALQDVHTKDNTKGSTPEEVVAEHCHNSCQRNIVALEHTGELPEGKVEEHLRKLTVSKRQSPQSKVRSSVGNCSEDELDSFNQGVDHVLTKGMSFFYGLHGLEFFGQICHLFFSFGHLLVNSGVIVHVGDGLVSRTLRPVVVDSGVVRATNLVEISHLRFVVFLVMRGTEA